MTAGEGRGLRLVRAMEHLHPSFQKALREVGARVYDLSFSGEPSVQVMNRIYVSFLHALCGSEYQVFVHHFVMGLKGEALDHLVHRLALVEASTRLSVLRKRNLRAMGFRAQGGPYVELTLATRSREALEALFEHGDMYLNFDGWILDRPDSISAIEFLRRMSFRELKEAPALWQSAVRDFSAFVQIREIHGPSVVTTILPDERLVSAAKQTAFELGYALRVE